MLPYRPADFDHLRDLLEMVPWDHNADGSSEVPHATLADFGATDQNRWSLLNNATLDWDMVRDRESDELDPAAVWRLCSGLQGALDDLPPHLLPVIGTMITGDIVVGPLNTVAALGARWVADVLDTCWRIMVPYRATTNRARRQDQPATMTPRP